MDSVLLNSATWPAPAKLNLFLHIIGRRSDGYHLLHTAFQFIDLVDEIDFIILDTDIVKRSSSIPNLVAQEDLVVRAANKLKHVTACRKGVDIHVKKNIPIGGGLGGGSSDAATTLVALNKLWQTGLSVDELATLGLELGADVPVFIRAHAAWADGVGEKLTPIAPEERIYLVINPGCSVATTDIFNARDLTRNTPAITMCDFLKQGGTNDCETVVRKHYSEVAKALDWFNNFAAARLTGTGACLFASFPDMQAAMVVKQQLPDVWQGYVVKGENQSPLLRRLAVERLST